jgi:hypothetical protein
MRQRDVNRGIKKILNSKKIPDMSKFNDLADYIMRNEKKKDKLMDSVLKVRWMIYQIQESYCQMIIKIKKRILALL